MNSTGKTLFAIVAHQRCGTHFLQAALRALGESVFQYDEVLYPGYEVTDKDQTPEEAGMFFPFFLERVRSDSRHLLITDYTVVDRLFESYFEDTAMRVPAPVVGYDLKLDQLSCFPRLHGSLREWGFRIVHLVRRNAIARIVSHHRMNALLKNGGVAGTTFHQQRHRVEPIVLNVEETIDWARRDRGHDNWFTSLFQDVPSQYRRVYFEDMVAAHSSAATLAGVSSFLGLPAPASEVQTVKQSEATLHEMVANYEELVAGLEQRGLLDLLGPAQGQTNSSEGNQ